MKIDLWNVETGDEIYRLTGNSSTVDSVVFSPDEKSIVSTHSNIIRFWETASGKLQFILKGHAGNINSILFSPDGKTLASRGNDKIIKLWDVSTAKERYTLTSKQESYYSMSFSTDGKELIIKDSSAKALETWDTETGKEILTKAPLQLSSRSEAYSVDGKFRANPNVDNTVTLTEIATNKELRIFKGHSAKVETVAFSPDGKILATGSEDKTVKLWNTATGEEIRTLSEHPSNVWALAFSSDGKRLASGSWETVKIWDVATGKELQTFEAYSAEFIYSLAFSFDGKFLATGGTDNIAKIWNLRTGKVLHILTGHSGSVNSLAFSPDGKILASGGWVDKTIRLWNVATGMEIHVLKEFSNSVMAVAFSSDGKIVTGKDYSLNLKQWDVATGNEIKDEQKIVKENPPLKNVAQINGKTVRVEVEGNAIVLIDEKTEDEIASRIALNEKEWVTIDADGRFDASQEAEKLMYYVANTPQFGYQVIAFGQIKERYYEPGLWQKLLGYNKEPLRDVAQFKDVLLPPEVESLEPADQNSTIRAVKLINKGGGIGRVQVFVNGREYLEDARDEKLKADPNLQEYVLSIDLKDASIIAGEKPDVKVVAWNYDEKGKERYKGYISSRGTAIFYLGNNAGTVEPPTLYAIIGGVSDYSGTQLDLSFAAKDAEDMYQAIQVGGKNLFTVERVKIKLLSTGGNKDAIAPTKTNFQKVFAEFAAEAKPNDILFVYLSGHGITLNFGSDTYYYLTQEANTTSKETLNRDSKLLESSTISSDELTQMHKSIKAQKQVLILDTCAAGAFGQDAKIAEKKDISSDAKRAIERMRDLLSFYVLMGSAANSYSYEASQYGQGLLTYSLLQGIRGAALEEDGTIDVSKLFKYAVNTVPDLAKSVTNGGIQIPEIRIPIGGTPFSIGLIKTDEDKRQIPLALVKPVILRPNFQNQNEGYDNLKIAGLLRDELREANYTVIRGNVYSGLVFVDTDEMPDAVIPTGTYIVEGDLIKITIKLIKNYKPLSTIYLVGNKNDLPSLVKRIVEAIIVKSQMTQKIK